MGLMLLLSVRRSSFNLRDPMLGGCKSTHGRTYTLTGMQRHCSEDEGFSVLVFGIPSELGSDVS